MDKLLFVFLGGGLGSLARYGVGVGWTRAGFSGWPYGTFTVNLVGGLLMGILAGWLAHRGGADQEKWRALFGVGVMGGFTTFSAFSLETALMIERKELLTAGTYVALSVLLSIMALFCGLLLSRRVFA